VINSSDGRVLATSLPLTADSTLQQVSWSGLSDLSSLPAVPCSFNSLLTTVNSIRSGSRLALRGAVTDIWPLEARFNKRD